MIKKTNIGLVEWCFKLLGLGYVYGTYFAWVITEEIIQAKARQYPTKYTAGYIKRSRKWVGKKAGDCVGVIKGYYWYDPSTDKVIYKKDGRPDVSANGMFAAAKIMSNKSASQNLGKTWGYLANLPERVGVLVWRDGHIGVYVGNEQVIESRGVDYGVVLTNVRQRGWTHWCLCPYIDYLTEEQEEEENNMPTVNPYPVPTKTYPMGITFTGSDARWFIFELLKRGHKLLTTSDVFGPNSWNALYIEQEKGGLQRGDAGPKTRALFLSEPTADYKTLYEAEKVRADNLQAKIDAALLEAKSVIRFLSS
jgi:hypothetical protein